MDSSCDDESAKVYTSLDDSVTRADLEEHYAKLGNLLKQIKQEVLAGQKAQLDRVFPQFTSSFLAEAMLEPTKLDHTRQVSEGSSSPDGSSSPERSGLVSSRPLGSRVSKRRFSADSVFLACSHKSSEQHYKTLGHSLQSEGKSSMASSALFGSELNSPSTSPRQKKNVAGNRTSAKRSTDERSGQRVIAEEPDAELTKSLSMAAGQKRDDKQVRFSKEAVQQNTLVSGRGDLGPDRMSFDFEDFEYSGSLRGSWKFLAKSLVKNPLFDAGCGCIIGLNAILVGVETEFLGQTGEIPTACDVLQMSLNLWYLVELLLRMVAFGSKFCQGEDAGWNIFDMMLVISAIIDFVLVNIRVFNFGAARALRALRLFRIVRTLRIIRQFKYVREFRKMVCSMTSSLSTLLWSLLLVFGVMYSFALWFTQTAAYYRKDHADDPAALRKAEVLEEYYTSMSRTLYSLFAAISGGYSWHVLLDPWIAVSDPWTVILFFAYISISVFGLLNIVTSVFVESAMSATKNFQDLLLDEKKKDLEMYTRHMQRIFHVIDADGGGSISFKEMRMFLNESSSELPAYLEALGITSSDVWVLFKLLDQDNSGSIDIEEFCEGCMRLKGEARSFDINCMMYESRAMLMHLADFMEFVEDRLEEMETETAAWLLEVDRRCAVRMQLLASKSAARLPKTAIQALPSMPLTPREKETNGSVSDSVGSAQRFPSPHQLQAPERTLHTRGMFFKRPVDSKQLESDGAIDAALGD